MEVCGRSMSSLFGRGASTTLICYLFAARFVAQAVQVHV